MSSGSSVPKPRLDNAVASASSYTAYTPVRRIEYVLDAKYHTRSMTHTILQYLYYSTSIYVLTQLYIELVLHLELLLIDPLHQLWDRDIFSGSWPDDMHRLSIKLHFAIWSFRWGQMHLQRWLCRPRWRHVHSLRSRQVQIWGRQW